MRRESHVRFWGRAEVKSLRATRFPLYPQSQMLAREGIRGQSADARLAARSERTRPLVDDLRTWLDRQLGRVSGRSPIAEAMRYGVSRWSGLGRFLNDGRIEIDTNTVERAIRPIALNRNYAQVRIMRRCSRPAPNRPWIDLISSRWPGRAAHNPHDLPHVCNHVKDDDHGRRATLAAECVRMAEAERPRSECVRVLRVPAVSRLNLEPLSMTAGNDAFASWRRSAEPDCNSAEFGWTYIAML